MKLLILSHNSIFSDTNMGETERKLLDAFDYSELMQINVRNCEKNNDSVKTLFIEEKNLLKSIFTRKNYWNDSTDTKRQSIDNSIAKLSYTESNRTSTTLILRDIVWRFGKWKTDYLDKWITQNKPEVLFLMPGDSLFIYRVAIYIRDKFNLNIVTYFGDDYSEGINNSSKFKDSYYRKKLQNQISEISSISSSVVCISDSLKDSYNKKFKINAITMPTPFDIQYSLKSNLNTPIKLTYIGNLTSGRLETIIGICETIEQVNNYSIKIAFDIYSPVLDNASFQDNIFQKYYQGFVAQSEVAEKVYYTDLLLHIETFDSNLFDSIKHSFSTKLANYLSSGRLIFSVGPSGLNSIDYLNDHQAAITSHDLLQFKNNLNHYLEDPKSWDHIADNAFNLSNERHNPDLNTKKIRSIIKGAKK